MLFYLKKVKSLKITMNMKNTMMMMKKKFLMMIMLNVNIETMNIYSKNK